MLISIKVPILASLSGSLDANASFNDDELRAMVGPLSDEQLRVLFPITDDKLRELYPDPRVCPVPEPTPPFIPIPGGFNTLWNVEADENMVGNVHRMWAEGKPAIVGPSNTAGVVLREPFLLPKSITMWGAGIRETTLVYQGEGDWFRSLTTEQTQTQMGFMRLERNGAAEHLEFKGLSNGSLLISIDFRGGRDQISLTPGGDKSAAFRATLINLFSFNAQGSLLKVRAGNGAAKTLCHITLIAIDGGRCNGAVLDFANLQPESSNIQLIGGTIDMRQGTMSAPHAVKFAKSGPVPFAWIGGKTPGTEDKDMIVSDEPKHEDNMLVKDVVMWNDPRPGMANFPRHQIKTPTLQLPGNANAGVCDWPQ